MERKWRKSKLEVYRQIYLDIRDQVNRTINSAKSGYYHHILEEGNQKEAFQVFTKLTKQSERVLPEAGDTRKLPNDCAKLFTEKVHNIEMCIDDIVKTENLKDPLDSVIRDAT